MKKLMAVLMAAALISASAMLASCDNNNNNGKESGSVSTSGTVDIPMEPPKIIGHEFIGRVAAISEEDAEASGIRIGDFFFDFTPILHNSGCNQRPFEI